MKHSWQMLWFLSPNNFIFCNSFPLIMLVCSQYYCCDFSFAIIIFLEEKAWYGILGDLFLITSEPVALEYCVCLCIAKYCIMFVNLNVLNTLQVVLHLESVLVLICCSQRRMLITLNSKNYGVLCTFVLYCCKWVGTWLFICSCFFTFCLGSKEVQDPQSRDSFQLFKHTALSKVKRTWAQLLKIFVIKIKLSCSVKLDGVFVCECSVVKRHYSSVALSLSFHLQSLGQNGACIMCSCSQFTEHLGWTPASFHLGEAPALILKRLSHRFSHGKCGSLFVLVKGVCFSGMFPFKVRTKQIQTKDWEKTCMDFCVCIWLCLAFSWVCSFLL